MERLISKAYIWQSGLSDGTDFNKLLNDKFLEDPNNELYLNLQFTSFDRQASYDILNRYREYSLKDFSIQKFGKYLLEDLKAIYKSNIFGINEFATKCHTLWVQLANNISYEEPFYILSYADDPLSWNDEAQTRKIYEELFEFYNQKDASITQ